jgi:hypothetical protein
MKLSKITHLTGKAATRTDKDTGIGYDVYIDDVKDGGWGRILVEVSPIRGRGKAWVTLESLTDITDKVS